jgi:hypothetical protein
VRVTGRESRPCPADMQDRLTRTFGTNIYGQPNFKIAWGASEFIRMGNIWRDRQGTERRGYRERYLAHGMSCWCILRWKSPATFGPPAVFYDNNYVAHTGLMATGEYPYEGRYEVLQALNYKEFVNGEMVVHNMPLTHLLIDMIIPMLLKAENLTRLEVIMAEQADARRKKQEHQQEIDDITSMMLDTLPYYGPISYTGQGIRSSFISKKVEQVQRMWNRLARFNMGSKTPRFMKGIQQGNRPRIAH